MSEKKKPGRPKTKVRRKQKAAYPPPPMLKEPVTSVYGNKTYVSTATIEEGPKEALTHRTRNYWLRQLAEVQYVTSQEFISISELANDPKFRHLTQAILARWSALDGWVEKRQEYFARLKAQLEQKIGNSLVRAQYAQLRDMDVLADDIKQRLRAGNIPVRSFEGLVKALLGVEEFRKTDRIRLASAMINEPLVGEAAPSSQVVPDLSDEEARQVATEIMRLRQKKVRAKLNEDNNMDNGSDANE